MTQSVWLPRLMLLTALALAAIYLFPLYWMYITAVKGQSEIYATPPTFWPLEPNVGIFAEVWQQRNMGSFLWNSLVIASGVTALTVALGVGIAYVLARYRNIWVDICLFVVLMLQVLPPSLMVTPLFVGFNQVGLLETPRWAVILAAAARSVPLFVVLSAPHS